MQASGPCSGFAVYFCPLSGTGHGCLIGNAILYPGWEEFPSVEQREGELVYLKLDMDGADGKALSSQGILAGTEYEYYKPFDDAPEYEEYKEVPKWLKVVAGVAVAAVVGLAVAATAASDQKNGTESSLGDYISNAFSASARVGASCIAITLGMYGEEVMTLTVSGGLGLIPVGGTVVTLSQLAGAFQLVAGIVTSQNLLFQIEEVLMFCTSGKEMGAPTGNGMHDSARELTEMASTQFAFYGLMNPYTYQRPKITLLPNETGLTVPGGTGVAVVPNGTAPALKQPYLPGQYSEYPAAVQGWAQQALPGGGSAIEGGSVPDFYVGPNGKELPSQYKDWIGTNIQKELLEQAENLQLQNAIKQLYRGNSFIGDGGTADVIRFEQQTGLMLGKNGGSHVQKGIDMAKYIENKILTQDLSPSDRALAIQLLEDLYSALGR